MPIRVLVVDNSAVVRQSLENELQKDSEIKVVGTASDPYIARDKIVELKPDVITLDIEMPRMDGLTFLKKLMQHHPIPVIIVSSVTGQSADTAIEAIQAGAVDVLSKPGASYTVGELGIELREKIKAAAKVKFCNIAKFSSSPVKSSNRSLTKTTDKVVTIGASTGGTSAVEHILKQFPSNAPGTIVVLHMPAGFTAGFAERLNELCDPQVKEAENGDSIVPGKVLVAPGNIHTLVGRSGAQYYIELKDGPLVGHHRPSINVLFKSVATYVGKNAIGIILTGMGNDGASGLKMMHEAGARTYAQDENSSIVYGMPKAAIELDAVDQVLSLDTIAVNILNECEN